MHITPLGTVPGPPVAQPSPDERGFSADPPQDSRPACRAPYLLCSCKHPGLCTPSWAPSLLGAQDTQTLRTAGPRAWVPLGVLLQGGGRSPPAADWLLTPPHLGYSLPATPVTRSQPDTDSQRWARQLQNLHRCRFASLSNVTVELLYHVVNCFLSITIMLEDGGNFLDATETLVCTLPLHKSP